MKMMENMHKHQCNIWMHTVTHYTDESNEQ